MRIILILVIATFVGCAHFSQTPAAENSINTDTSLVYRCNSGHIVKASYRSGTTAVVQYEGRTREMIIVISGSGARYAGGGLEWWTKGMGPGSEGTLLHHKNDGTSGDIIERCIQVSAG